MNYKIIKNENKGHYHLNVAVLHILENTKTIHRFAIYREEYVTPIFVIYLIKRDNIASIVKEYLISNNICSEITSYSEGLYKLILNQHVVLELM